MDRTTMPIDSLSPLNIVYHGNHVLPLIFPLLPMDVPFFRLSFDLFSRLALCFWAPGYEPPEGLLYVSSYMLGCVCLDLEVELFLQKYLVSLPTFHVLVFKIKN